MTQRGHKPIATPRRKASFTAKKTVRWNEGCDDSKTWNRRHEDNRQWLEEQFSKRRNVSKTTKFCVSILYPIWRYIFVFCKSLSSTMFSMSCSVDEANLEVMFLRLHWLTAGRRGNTKRANLTWLPSEIMHRGQTWQLLPVTLTLSVLHWSLTCDYCIICRYQSSSSRIVPGEKQLCHNRSAG